MRHQKSDFIISYQKVRNRREVHHNGEVLKTNNASKIVYTIDLVKDSTHNKEYSCIGNTNQEKSYLNLSIVALSK